MAIDKAVDSAALDASFLAIANAIRTKGGTSASLTPGQMPAAIAAIQSGISYSSNWYVKEWTQASDSQSVTITHNLGALPRIILCYALDPLYTANEFLAAVLFLKPSDGTWSNTYVFSTNGTGSGIYQSNAINLSTQQGYNGFEVTTTTATITKGQYYSATFKSGQKYLFLAYHPGGAS